MELTMNTRREIVKKWHRNIKKPLGKKKIFLPDTRTYTSWFLLYHERKFYFAGQKGKRHTNICSKKTDPRSTSLLKNSLLKMFTPLLRIGSNILFL